MKAIVTPACEKMLGKLPEDISEHFTAQQALLAESTRNPRLHIKKLRDEDDVYSFRITRRYRALFYFQNSSTIIIFAVDHRKDVYR
jgi:mRNA-degrading endonuclease RelE of RelBE toxin-antitoxin system